LPPSAPSSAAILPFLVGSGWSAAAGAAALCAVALVGLGAPITLLTGQPALRSGARQVAFGLAAAAITLGVGRLLGVALGG